MAEKEEILGALGLDKPVPPPTGSGPISPDVLRAELGGPAPAGLDALKEGMMAFMYLLAQTVATTPPFDELTEASLDIMKRIGKVIDVNEALIKAQTVMGGLGAGAPMAGGSMPAGPTPAGPPFGGPTPPTPTPPMGGASPEGAPNLEGIEI
jgi:hypothetical protein